MGAVSNCEDLNIIIMTEKFCLKWNDFHSNIGKSFKSLRYEDNLFDVTLVSNDHNQVSAHKLVLSACSEYFKTLFKKNKHSHPMICLEGVNSQELNNALDYIYNGEIQIYQDHLDRFLNIAQRFELEGLLGDQSSTQEEKYELPMYDDDVKVNDHQPFEEEDPISTVTPKATRTLKSFETSIISANFNSLDELNQRIEKEIVREVDGTFKCAKCLRTFKRKDNLKEHIETHFEGLSFPCQLCGKDFRSRNNLRKHGITQHRN